MVEAPCARCVRSQPIFAIRWDVGVTTNGAQPGVRLAKAAAAGAAAGRVLGVPASYLALAGRVYVVPVAALTHGHILFPKKAGIEVRYIEFGMTNPPGVLCQRCEFVRKS